MKKRLALVMVLFFLLLPALILLAGYISWPLWATGAARVVLADYDIRLQQAEIGRPGWNAISINELALSYRTAEYEVRLNSPQLSASYSWATLMQGRFETLRVVDAQLQLLPAASKAPVSETPLSVPLILPQTLFAQLPVKQLDIASVELKAAHWGRFEQWAGSLHYQQDEMVLHLASFDDPAVVFDLKADRQNRLELSVSQAEHQLIQIRHHIIVDVDVDAGLAHHQGDVTVDLQRSAAILTELGLIDARYQLSGEARLQWQGDLPKIMDTHDWHSWGLAGEFSGDGAIIDSLSSTRSQLQINSGFEVSEGTLNAQLAEFTLSGATDVSEQLAGWFPVGTGQALPFTLQLTPDTQLHARFSPFDIRLTKGAADITVGKAATAVFADIQLDALNLQANGGWRGQADFTSHLFLKQLRHADLAARALDFKTAGQARFEPGAVVLQLAANSELRGEKIKAIQAQIPLMRLTSAQPLRVAWQGQQLSVPEGEFRIKGMQLLWQDQPYQFDTAALAFKAFELDWQGALRVTGSLDTRVSGLELQLADLALKPLALHGSWSLTGQAVKGSLQLTDAARLLDVSGRVQHHLDSGRGTLVMQSKSLAFNEREAYLPRLFKTWPYHFDVFAGRAEMNSTLTWGGSQVEIKARVALNNVGGFYQNNLFHGLNTEVLIDGPLGDPRLVAEQVRLAKLEAGIAINKVKFSLDSTGHSLRVRDFQAELLGGQVSQRLVTYDWMKDDNELVLQLENIHLNEILQLEMGVEGIGILDGQLPITITREGIIMQHGQLQARSPGGVIKYQRAASVASLAAETGVKFALDALQNFQYEMLDVNADYAENGELRLQVTLLGRNPDLPEERPIRFNITVRENIPALIKSLKLSRQISDDIDRRIRAFYERKNRK